MKGKWVSAHPVHSGSQEITATSRDQVPVCTAEQHTMLRRPIPTLTLKEQSLQCGHVTIRPKRDAEFYCFVFHTHTCILTTSCTHLMDTGPH